MKTYTLHRSQIVPADIDQVFGFFSDAHNLDRLTPPWLGFEVLTPRPIDMQRGTKIEYRIRWHVISMRWLTEIVRWEPGVEFVDVQRRGPYRRWHHTHRFERVDEGTRVDDIVDYALPLGPVGHVAHRCLVKRDIERIFDYRQSQMRAIFGGSGIPHGRFVGSPAA